ncbi:site-specific integrase [Candidatus Woesearchaeota archaeon]|nr:site-specific integrase [Candidatus Woesearchaeota archaeon]
MAKKRGITYLSIKELHRFVNSISSTRDKLIVKTLFETGCTVNELIHIKIDDIDFTKNVIYFPAESTKSNKQKRSIISRSLASKIKVYVKDCKQEYLFSTRQSAMMTTKRVRQLVQFYGKLANFPEKLNPQTLRYSHIAHALENGISLIAIQEQTGLEKLRLMQIYEAILPETAKDVYTKFFDT